MKKIIILLFAIGFPLSVMADAIQFNGVQSGFSGRNFLTPAANSIDCGESQFYASQVRASHILVNRQSDAEKIRKQIVDGEISFEDAAKKYSLCPSKNEGGDLGFFPRGAMVSSFEKVAFTLPIGEISQPVETRFGWHLILVTDKK